MKVLIIDPPGGWRYGFPRPVHEEFHTLGDDFDLGGWLISEGYPEQDIDLALKYSRYWEQEVNDGWYEGRAARDNMSNPGDKNYD